MRFEQPAKFNQGAAQHLRIDRGIYPYLGAAVEVRQLRRAASLYGYAAVPGIRGARLAMQARTGVLVDPAEYITRGRDRSDSGQHGLWACDEWLERERAARVPVLVTDTSRIARADQQALRKALCAGNRDLVSVSGSNWSQLRGPRSRSPRRSATRYRGPFTTATL